MTNSIADRLRALALESVDERGNPLAVITSPGLIIDAANEIEGLQRELAMNQEFHNIDDVVEIRKLRAALEEIADLPATPEDGLSTATLIADFALSAGYSAPEPNDARPRTLRREEAAAAAGAELTAAGSNCGARWFGGERVCTLPQGHDGPHGTAERAISSQLAASANLCPHGFMPELCSQCAEKSSGDVPWFGRYQALVSACTLAGFRPEAQDDPHFGGKRIVLVPMQTLGNPSVPPWKCDWPGCTRKEIHAHAGMPSTTL